ncbi:MAG: hypothetical protein M1830_001086 [Pleopsidium flavum]|nr:MAG: hypothetical protein M1830_001086 [Pleopsidium flavum]
MATHNPVLVVSPMDDEMMQTPKKLEEHKPLPRLPRGRSRLCHETSLFLRGIGLGIVPTILQGLFRKDFSEPQKVAVHQSRVIALFRALIHVVPLTVALMEIILNWKGHYIGMAFDKQSYYQFAAKAHEITLQASLVSIALSYIRFQLTFGNGLPFGAFLSGLQITQISYLWSTELWSSLFVTSKTFQLRSKLALLAMVTICGLIAATAGPSSAVLLIPRQTRWHSESTYFYVNGTFQDVWPDRVDAKKIPKHCAVISSSRTVDPVCPAADWHGLASGIFGFTSEHRVAFEASVDVTDTWDLQNPDSSHKKTAIDRCTNSAKNQYCGSCPQVAVLKGVMDLAMAYTASMFNANTTFSNLYANLDKDLFQSYTLSTCVFDTFQETEDQKQLQFARITETGRQDTQNRTIVAVPSLPSVLTAPGNMSEYRLQWVNLPPDNFSNAAIGAVLLHPRVPESQSQNITTCTLGAGWGTSSLNTDISSAYTFFSTITGVPSYFRTVQTSTEPQIFSVPDFANISGYAFPQRRIKISEDWAQFLNPTFIKPDGSNTTMIHNYMSASSYPLGEIGTSKIMSAILTAGLSLVGNELSWQAIPNSTAPCEGCLVFEVSNSIQGWAYTIDGTFTILAIVVMFGFCVLAFGHTIYLGVSGVSSNAWSSTAEIVALAMNSSPTVYLQNTCAGIIGVNTFKTPVQILVRGDNDQTEHLELVFGDQETADAGASKLTKNKDYGELLTKGYTTSVQVHPAP